MMRFDGNEPDDTRSDLRVIPFPRRDAESEGTDEQDGALPVRFARTADDLLRSLNSMSRKIQDLARELHCLGHFDDGDDGPRAA